MFVNQKAEDSALPYHANDNGYEGLNKLSAKQYVQLRSRYQQYLCTST